MRLMLAAQAVSGGMSRGQRREWRAWRLGHRGAVTDPARLPQDPGPALAELLMELQAAARHPRAWLRGLGRR
jgi:hypothetical protein